MWLVKKSCMALEYLLLKIYLREKIIEYIGEKIAKSEGDRRSELRKKYLNSDKTGSVYF